MILYPNCKINLGLCVTEKRPDGYHNLETVFYPVPLCDQLEIELADEDSFCQDGNTLDCNDQDNLVLKVVRLLRQKGYHVPALKIRLRKVIPSGAGLGGGSSDAAFTMKAINLLCQLGISDEDMEKMLSPLGADCPVFVRNRAVFAQGIGDIFTDITLDLSGWHLVLVKPDDFVSTKEAYSGVRPHAPQHNLLEVIQEPVHTWRGRMVNDFEVSVFPQHPTISNICDRLYQMGAAYAAMSGSGSTVYGLFRQDVPNLQLEFPTCFVFQSRCPLPANSDRES